MEKSVRIELTEEQVALLSKVLAMLDFSADDYNNLCSIRQVLAKKQYSRWDFLKKRLPPTLIRDWSKADKKFDHDSNVLLGDINKDWWGPISSHMLDMISAWSKGDYDIDSDDFSDFDKRLLTWRDDCLYFENMGYTPVPVTYDQMIKDIAEC